MVIDREALIEHSAYWAPARTVGEARYLTGILNSETARALREEARPNGQGVARHSDNPLWGLPIPKYDRHISLHQDLVAAASAAERVANAVVLPEDVYFTRRRRAIRDALVADGVARKIEALVVRLLHR